MRKTVRDLKYLIEFEDLLQEANNTLVRQAKKDGKLALGYTCYFMPEVLLDGCGLPEALRPTLPAIICPTGAVPMQDLC